MVESDESVALSNHPRFCLNKITALFCILSLRGSICNALSGCLSNLSELCCLFKADRIS